MLSLIAKSLLSRQLTLAQFLLMMLFQPSMLILSLWRTKLIRLDSSILLKTIGASSYFTTSGNYGGALNLNDAESAQRAFENMTREISDLAEQVDKLTQNMSQVNLAHESSGRQLAIRKDLNLIDTDNILKEETLNLKQIEILREYHMSLLHKVMRVNEDMVRMLVLK